MKSRKAGPEALPAKKPERVASTLRRNGWAEQNRVSISIPNPKTNQMYGNFYY